MLYVDVRVDRIELRSTDSPSEATDIAKQDFANGCDRTLVCKEQSAALGLEASTSQRFREIGGESLRCRKFQSGDYEEEKVRRYKIL